MVRKKKYSRYFVYAVLVHVVFVGLLVVSLEWTATPDMPGMEEEIVQAVVVDESRVKKELEKLKKAEEKKRRNEEARKNKLDKQAKAAESKRKKEEKHLQDLKKKRESEKKKAKQEEKQRKVAAEKLRKAQEKEKKQLADLQKQKEAEAQRVADLEQKRKKEESEARRKQMEEEMQRELAKEEAALSARQSKMIQSEVGKYTAKIRAKVSNSWLQPTNFKSGSSCVVLVKLIPTGDVIDVKVTRCKGGGIFQRSVESAVRKASPLPVPKDPAVFNEMREIEFTFKPEIST